jgi:protein with PEP-CTERM/exosortase system signal
MASNVLDLRLVTKFINWQSNMKSLKYLLAIAAVTDVLTLSAKADQVFGGEQVPDNGATLMLLGGALAGLALVRRYLKR